jgi:hypothetical protein
MLASWVAGSGDAPFDWLVVFDKRDKLVGFERKLKILLMPNCL